MAKQAKVQKGTERRVSARRARAKPLDPERQLKIQQALYEIADAASAVADMQSFYKKLHRIVGKLMYAENFIVALVDEHAKLVSMPYFADSAGDEPPPVHSMEVFSIGMAGYVFQKGKLLHASRARIQELSRRKLVQPQGTVAEDWIGVPLTTEGQKLGVLMVQSYKKGIRYTEEDAQVLSFVAQHIAVALTRARAIEETRQRNAELQIINRIQEGLASKLDTQAIYDLVGDKIREIFDAESIMINMFDHETRTILMRYWFVYGEHRPASDMSFTPFVERFIESEKTVLINENAEQRVDELGIFVRDRSYIPKSMVFVPLITAHKVQGFVSLRNFSRENAFSESDVRLLETLTNSMNVALENARLLDETQQSNAELAILNSVQAALAGQLDMHGIYEAVGDKLREIFSYQDVTIYTGDLRSRLVTVEYSYELGKRNQRRSVPMNSLYEYFVTSNRTFVFNGDVSSFAAKFSDYQNAEPPKSLLAVPVRRNNDAEPVVYLTIQDWNGDKVFSDSDVRLMQTLANSMSVALENARLFDETERRAVELQIINTVQEGLASRLEIQSIYDLVGEKIRETFREQAQTVFFAFYDPDTDLADYPYLYQNGRVRQIKGWKPDIPIARRQIQTPETIFLRTAADVERYGMTSDYARSAVFVPFLQGAELHGVIAIINQEREFAFTESDVRLLETLANSMSVALENARLWEQEKLYRKALQRELEIGREIQAGFLPEALPLIEGWEIAASLMSAREVAGDFYDAFELPDGTIGLIVADVCDKGVGAALFMTLFRSLIRATANMEYFEHTERLGAPRSTEDRLLRSMLLTNNYIAETHGESGMFATVFFGILDPRDGRLLYINGGHEPPLIAEAGVVGASLRKTGPALGAITDCEFHVAQAHLERGQTLLAFTDGVPDAKNPRGEFFGRTRLLEVLGQSSASAHALVKRLQLELQQHAAGTTQFDDITLLAVTRA